MNKKLSDKDLKDWKDFVKSKEKVIPKDNDINFSVKKNSSNIVLSADTIVAVGRRILLKPNNIDEASDFLSLLSGRRHRVHTSICIFYNHKFYQKNITTILKMKR